MMDEGAYRERVYDFVRDLIQPKYAKDDWAVEKITDILIEIDFEPEEKRG